MPSTAELQSVLTGDTKPFEKAMDKAVAKSKTTGHEIEKSFNPIHHGLEEIKHAFIGAFAAEKIIEFGKETFEMGRQLEDASERLNLSTDAVQGLQYAFMRSGATREQFEKGMVKLNQSLDDARDGNEKMIESLRRLGVEEDDIKKKSPEQILYMMADGMKNAKNPTQSLAAAMDLLGKTGFRMIPGLKGGAEELAHLAHEVNKLSEEQVKSLASAGKAVERFTLDLKVMGAQTLLGEPPKWLYAMVPIVAYNSRALKFLYDQLKNPPDFPKGYRPNHEPHVTLPQDEEEEEDMPSGSRKPTMSSQTREQRHAYAGHILEEERKEEEALAKFMDDDLKHRQEMFLDIQKIEEETWYIERDTARMGMSSAQLIVALEEDRAKWLEKALGYERDISGIHFKDAALARQQSARTQQHIDQMRADEEEKPKTDHQGPGARDAFDRFHKFGVFMNFKTATGKGGGGLTTGGLTTGSLESGGIGDVHSRVRHGDAARHKAAVKAEKEKSKGVEGRLDKIIGLLGDDAGPVKQ